MSESGGFPGCSRLVQQVQTVTGLHQTTPYTGVSGSAVYRADQPQMDAHKQKYQ